MKKNELKQSILLSCAIPVTIKQLNKLYFAGNMVITSVWELYKEGKLFMFSINNDTKFVNSKTVITIKGE